MGYTINKEHIKNTITDSPIDNEKGRFSLASYKTLLEIGQIGDVNLDNASYLDQLATKIVTGIRTHIG